jgi:hypothetical protein
MSSLSDAGKIVESREKPMQNLTTVGRGKSLFFSNGFTRLFTTYARYRSLGAE